MISIVDVALVEDRKILHHQQFDSTTVDVMICTPTSKKRSIFVDV